MGKRKVATIGMAIVLVTALAIFLRRRELSPAAVLIKPPPVPQAQLPLPTPPPKQARSSMTMQHVDQAASDPEFQSWLRSESEDVDRIDANGDTKALQLKALVQNLTPLQAQILVRTIENPKATSREKILSTYLLVEGGLKTQTELTNLIVSPLREARDFAPHSEEEMKGVREKSLRIMAIDGLVSQARQEPSARAALARVARETEDPTIRSYAENKLRELQ